MNDNPVMAQTLLTGSVALILWGFIWFRAIRRPLGWIGPTSLFALGLLILYIVPSLYWQFRSWSEPYPPYFDGIPLVMTGAILLGVPFLAGSLENRPKQKMLQELFRRQFGIYGRSLWFGLIPVLSGIGYRLYMFTLGFQGRNIREWPTILGFESLALIVYALTIYFPVFYYPLIAFGNLLQRRVGSLVWIIDGLLQLATLHRWAILLFILRSTVFAALMGWRLKTRHWIGVVLVGIFTIAIIGQAGLLSRDIVDISNVMYLGPTQVPTVIGMSVKYFSETASSIIDEVMFRLYLARSASAVMQSTPDIIPYFYGETFLHILYAWVPRFFWTDKPDMGEVHLLTTLVMPNDSGISPTGTIAELYVNYGFLAIFLGGLLCFIITRWMERALMRGGRNSRVWLCVYPGVCMWIIWADANLSQRLTESLRMLLIFGAVWLLLWISRVRKTT